MLTKKQSELLRFIHERLKEAGVPPSFDEMKDALDLRSKSGIHRLITALEERGFIRRLPNRARAIEVIKLPESVARSRGPRPRVSRRASSKAISEGSRRRSFGGGRRPSGRRAGDGPHRRRHADRGNPDPQPHHQRAAGHARSGEHFALEVRGDSMVDAGILDGDMALITQRIRRDRRHRRGADRRRGGDLEALPPARRLDRARTGQSRVRDADLWTGPGAGSGQDGEPVPALLSPSRRRAGLRIGSLRGDPARCGGTGSPAERLIVRQRRPTVSTLRRTVLLQSFML